MNTRLNYPYNSRTQKIAFYAIISLIVLSTGGFEYVNWNPTYAGWISNILYIGLLVTYMAMKPMRTHCHFKTLVLMIMFLPFLSIINSWSFFSQSPIDSIKALLGQFIWIIYFLLHKYKISESTLLKVFLYVALFIAAVLIIQQFTYPDAPFGTRPPETMMEQGLFETAEQRNGLWRFRMHQNAYFTAPILFVCWLWLRQKMNAKLMILTIILMASVYLTLTRQVMVACILTIFCSTFMGKKKINFTVLFLGIAFIAALYIFYDVLFSSLAEKTQDESSEDNIRVLSATYFWNESIKTPLTFLFGYGLPAYGGQFASYMNELTTIFHFYTSDVGFVGQIFEKGVLYVLVCYLLFCKTFFKNKTLIPTYIRMFVLFTGVMSVMIFPCINPATNIVWIMLLYICDLHINKSPLTVK